MDRKRKLEEVDAPDSKIQCLTHGNASHLHVPVNPFIAKSGTSLFWKDIEETLNEDMRTQYQ